MAKKKDDIEFGSFEDWKKSLTKDELDRIMRGILRSNRINTNAALRDDIAKVRRYNNESVRQTGTVPVVARGANWDIPDYNPVANESPFSAGRVFRERADNVHPIFRDTEYALSSTPEPRTTPAPVVAESNATVPVSAPVPVERAVESPAITAQDIENAGQYYNQTNPYVPSDIDLLAPENISPSSVAQRRSNGLPNVEDIGPIPEEQGFVPFGPGDLATDIIDDGITVDTSYIDGPGAGFVNPEGIGLDNQATIPYDGKVDLSDFEPMVKEPAKTDAKSKPKAKPKATSKATSKKKNTVAPAITSKVARNAADNTRYQRATPGRVVPAGLREFNPNTDTLTKKLRWGPSMRYEHVNDFLNDPADYRKRLDNNKRQMAYEQNRVLDMF